MKKSNVHGHYYYRVDEELTPEEIKAMIKEANELHRKSDRIETRRHLIFWVLFLGIWFVIIKIILNLAS